MANTVGGCVEGDKLQLITRRFLARTPIWRGSPRRLVTPFKLSIYGKAVIVEQLGATAQAEVEDSARAVGAEISGETISGHAGRLSREALVNATGGHKGKAIKASKIALARVDIPLRQVAAGAQLAAA